MYPSHFGTEIGRIKALGAVGLSLLLILVFASAAQAMPADPPSGLDGKHQALVSQPQVREGPSSVWEAEAATVAGPVGGQERAEIQHLSGSVPATVAGPVGGQERAEIQHLSGSVPATVAGPVGGQERAEIQHVGEAPQPVADLDPAPSTPVASNSDTELVIAIASILALAAFGGVMWSRRQTFKTA
jgi:hypothetical protein